MSEQKSEPLAAFPESAELEPNKFEQECPAVLVDETLVTERFDYEFNT